MICRRDHHSRWGRGKPINVIQHSAEAFKAARLPPSILRIKGSIVHALKWLRQSSWPLAARCILTSDGMSIVELQPPCKMVSRPRDRLGSCGQRVPFHAGCAAAPYASATDFRADGGHGRSLSAGGWNRYRAGDAGPVRRSAAPDAAPYTVAPAHGAAHGGGRHADTVPVSYTHLTLPTSDLV